MIYSSANILEALGGDAIIRQEARLSIVDGRPGLGFDEYVYIYVDRYPTVEDYQATWKIWVVNGGSDLLDLVLNSMASLLPNFDFNGKHYTTTDFASDKTVVKTKAEIELEATRAERERLQKVLAEAGVDSRRRCEELIRGGQVAVNGAVVTTLGTRIDPARDRVTLDGQPVRLESKVYIALNKPAGVVCTARDPQGRKRAVDLLPAGLPRVFTVGRLDRDSEGLLFLTNDGAIDTIGVSTNELTRSEDRDPFVGTPWHKYVPARLEPLALLVRLDPQEVTAVMAAQEPQDQQIGRAHV